VTRWFYATEGGRLVDQRVSPRIVWRGAARHLASAALYVLSADAASLPLSPRLALIAAGGAVALVAACRGQP